MITLTNALGSTMELQLTMGWTKVNHAVTVNAERLLGDGSVFTGSSVDPKTFTLEGSLYYKTKEANLEHFDDLKRFLTHTPVQVDRGDGRDIIAYPTSLDADWMDDDDELGLTIGMTALDPFFYGPPILVEQTLTANAGIAVEPLGNIPAMPLVTMAITGTVTDPALTCGDYLMEIVGTYTTGTIIVDCKRMRATYGGVGIIGAMGEDWLTKGFLLTPDSESVAFTATGSYSIAMAITWRPRYL